MSTSARFHAALAAMLGAFSVAGVLLFLRDVTQVAAHPLAPGLPLGNVELAAVQAQWAPGELLTITVTPNPVTVTVGATLTFSAAGLSKHGRPRPITPVWDTNGGLIDASGIFTAQTSVASGRLVTATSGHISGTALVNLVAAEPYTVMLDVAPIPLTVGDNGVLTATVTDRYGNGVANGTPVTFIASRGNVISPVPTTDGVATTLLSDTLVGTHVVTAVSGSAPSATQSVTLEPGEAFNIKLDVRPPLLTVGWVSMLAMTVTDRYGNAVAPGVEITLEADWGNLTSPAYTEGGGRATAPIVAYQPGADHITATSQAAFTIATVTYIPDAPNNVTLEADPTLPVVGNDTVLTATVRDRYGNPVADGTPVAFSHDLGNLVPPVAQTTNGIVTARISSTLPGTAHITAASGFAPPGAATVIFQPDEPETVTLVAAPTFLVVGANSVLTATVADRYNNPVKDGTPVTFTVSRGRVISPVPTTNGVATSLFSDTLVGTRLVTAASESAPPATRQVTFTAGPPFTITVKVNPVNLFANSNATARITATITDRYNNPLAGLKLTGSFPTGTMGAISGLGITNSAGRATGAWAAGTRPGQAPLRVTNGAITGSIDVALITGPPATLTMQVGLQTLIANSGMTSPIAVTAVDRYGTGLAGLGVSARVIPSSLGNLSLFGPTGDDGQVFGAWTAGPVIGSGLLQVYLTGDTFVSDSMAVSLTFTDPHTITPQVSLPTLAAFSGATAAITATVADRYGNPVPGLTLSGSTFPPTLGSVAWEGATNSSGQVFGAWTATPTSAAGSGVISVSLDSISGAVAISLTPGFIYLPHFRGTGGIQNGDFSWPDLADWTIDPAGVLSVSASIDPTRPGDPVALLGSPGYACRDGMPIGYAVLSQAFIMPDVPVGKVPVLKFSYHIYTNDKNYNLNDVADRFDVLLNGVVVLKDMNQSLLYTCDALYDLGRKEAAIPITGDPGDSINLTFRLKNGFDDDYNTYVYIDDVRLDYEALAPP